MTTADMLVRGFRDAIWGLALIAMAAAAYGVGYHSGGLASQGALVAAQHRCPEEFLRAPTNPQHHGAPSEEP